MAAFLVGSLVLATCLYVFFGLIAFGASGDRVPRWAVPAVILLYGSGAIGFLYVFGLLATGIGRAILR